MKTHAEVNETINIATLYVPVKIRKSIKNRRRIRLGAVPPGRECSQMGSQS
jgi:hypothetical protein